MLMPSLLRDNFMDDFFDLPSFGRWSSPASQQARMMHTDVKERKDGYEIAMNLPGFKKEDVTAELKDGYLTIQAVSNTTNEEKDDDGRYLRRERYSGSCSRSFYVGEQVTEEDIKAKFEDGVLKIDVPKKEAQPEIETKKYIAIEG